jgi:uncharacterized protein YndB with AHSA1/START domain
MPPNSAKASLKIVRQFSAPVEKVYQAWTDPKQTLNRWCSGWGREKPVAKALILT